MWAMPLEICNSKMFVSRKEPAAASSPFHSIWGEIWDFIVPTQVDKNARKIS